MRHEQPEEAAMTRRDEHLDAMLRHLGAAYYDSQHGRASSADVARALDAVEERNGQPPGPAQARRPSHTAHPGAPARDGQPAGRDLLGHQVRWRQRVWDVMTTKVITVDRITPYKEIAWLLAKHKISAVLLSKVLPTDPDAISVRVRNGVVSLGGHPAAGTDPGLVPVAVRLIWDIAGVVDVNEKIDAPQPA